MTVSVFGTSVNLHVNEVRGQPGVGYKILDSDGNFDISNKRLANVDDPIELNDAANKQYIDSKIDLADKKIYEIEKNFIEYNDTVSKIVESNKKTIETKLDEYIKNIMDLIDKRQDQITKHYDMIIKQLNDKLNLRINDIETDIK